MEIYEADSRINAAAYRTAFRAMGRAFFPRGSRSCPHFTINVVCSFDSFDAFLSRAPHSGSRTASAGYLARNK